MHLEVLSSFLTFKLLSKYRKPSLDKKQNRFFILFGPNFSVKISCKLLRNFLVHFVVVPTKTHRLLSTHFLASEAASSNLSASGIEGLDLRGFLFFFPLSTTALVSKLSFLPRHLSSRCVVASRLERLLTSLGDVSLASLWALFDVDSAEQPRWWTWAFTCRVSEMEV